MDINYYTNEGEFYYKDENGRFHEAVLNLENNKYISKDRNIIKEGSLLTKKDIFLEILTTVNIVTDPKKYPVVELSRLINLFLILFPNGRDPVTLENIFDENDEDNDPKELAALKDIAKEILRIVSFKIKRGETESFPDFEERFMAEVKPKSNLSNELKKAIAENFLNLQNKKNLDKTFLEVMNNKNIYENCKFLNLEKIGLNNHSNKEELEKIKSFVDNIDLTFSNTLDPNRHEKVLFITKEIMLSEANIDQEKFAKFEKFMAAYKDKYSLDNTKQNSMEKRFVSHYLAYKHIQKNISIEDIVSVHSQLQTDYSRFAKNLFFIFNDEHEAWSLKFAIEATTGRQANCERKNWENFFRFAIKEGDTDNPITKSFNKKLFESGVSKDELELHFNTIKNEFYGDILERISDISDFKYKGMDFNKEIIGKLDHKQEKFNSLTELVEKNNNTAKLFMNTKDKSETKTTFMEKE